MPDHAERRPWRHTGAVMAAAMTLTVAVTGCGRHATATAAAGRDAQRFAVTRADGSHVTVPRTRPVVLDFVSAGCVTGLATATDPGGGLLAAYRIQAVGTTVQAPDGAVAYSGIDASLSTITAAITTAAGR
jgi:hypothetical protein